MQLWPCRGDLREELKEDIIELVELLPVVGVELEGRERDAWVIGSCNTDCSELGIFYLDDSEPILLLYF